MKSQQKKLKLERKKGVSDEDHYHMVSQFLPKILLAAVDLDVIESANKKITHGIVIDSQKITLQLAALTAALAKTYRAMLLIQLSMSENQSETATDCLRHIQDILTDETYNALERVTSGAMAALISV